MQFGNPPEKDFVRNRREKDNQNLSGASIQVISRGFSELLPPRKVSIPFEGL
jgi:hypothetical protein